MTLCPCDITTETNKDRADLKSIMPSPCDSLIDDIEDMVSSSDPTPHERQSARKSIMPRFRKKKEPLSQEELHTDSLIPGTQKIWMKTWGCSHNNSDGEYMAGQLAASGYKMTGKSLAKEQSPFIYHFD
ncbi:hypothetical protein JOQ06_025417 [Pogonophryne albipinna]|uniref:MTTase N-terminal domain-containing protein n=1 Tax=Pogonophryne albipinna TaxID=1090488 RepID=A0AAD6FEP3_9TELE|nr:hypothetical protein JOQ06_025417 [Pogonophryne albipinna]